MAAPTFGRIQEYQPENELFSAYLERVELFFLANGVEDDKRVPIFLSVVGSKTYSVLRNLVALTLPQEKTFAQLVTMFCTIRVFIPYAYGTYHTRIRIWYNHTRMVRIIVPYAYGAYETPLVYI